MIRRAGDMGPPPDLGSALWLALIEALDAGRCEDARTIAHMIEARRQEVIEHASKQGVA